jgi:hypothetical protein
MQNKFNNVDIIFNDLLLKSNRFKELPIEAIVKQDILRLGLSFSSIALLLFKQYKPKDYFIFSFDLVELKNMTQQENLRAPEEIRISGGPFNLRPTIISVRVNPNSPYNVSVNNEQICLMLGENIVAKVECQPIPMYYQQQEINGKSIGEICPAIEWGYLLYLTVYRTCEYFNTNEQCQFCDINANFKQQRKAGRKYTGIKSIEELIEALSYVDKLDQTAKAYTLTGGSIASTLRQESEVEFYTKYSLAINNKFPDRWIAKAVVQAWQKDDCKKLKDSGIKIYHPNYEVWGEALFNRLCPGKARNIGFKTWISRILDAGEIFGVENVIPNFVAGVEMNNVCGNQDMTSVISSVHEGLDFFMSRGIMPRFTTWCPEPLAVLGPQPPAPLEYYCHLLSIWKELFEQYKLPIPEGYGDYGVGKAVFGVSAFMDIIGYDEKTDSRKSCVHK